MRKSTLDRVQRVMMRFIRWVPKTLKELSTLIVALTGFILALHQLWKAMGM